MDDIQVRGYYLTYAIRRVHALAGRKIAVIGHSQGGMVMRLALRFWPGTRSMVDDVIGIAGSNHGSTQIASQCATGCSAAFRQQAAGSMFEQALNSRQETFSGISYTEISSNTDEVVTPSGVNGVSSVHGPGEVTNVAVQQICPGDVSHEHLLLAADPVTWALANDALTHPGPADPSRIDRSVCSATFPPGADPSTFYTDEAASLAALADAIATYPQVPAEPAPMCWVYATCTGAAAPSLQLLNRHRVIHHRRYVRIRFLVRTQEGNTLVPVPGVTVQIGGQRLVTTADGAATVTLRHGPRRSALAIANRPGCNSARETVRL
jgi:pimeloyl-ACP methyl ester carboxylesterase